MFALAGVLSAVSGVKSLLGGGIGDAGVIAIGQKDAQQQLQCALAGDVLAGRVMVYGRDSSTRQEIRDAYAQAWTILKSQRPDVAAAAEKAGGVSLTDSVRDCASRVAAGTGQILPMTVTAPAPSPVQNALSAIGSSIQQGINNVRQTTATEVQQLGAGGTAALAQQIAPSGSRTEGAINIPTDKSTLLLVGGGLALLIVLLLVLRR